MDMRCTRCQGSGEEPNFPGSYAHTFKSAAKEIREAAKETRERAKLWPGDKYMQEMYIQDARDLREVAKLLRTGDARGACNKAASMDTGARDNIPQAAWDFMEDAAQSSQDYR